MTNRELADLLALDRTAIPPAGNEQYNSLIHCDSPYLLQHATNPVRWRPWDPALLIESHELNRPLFISIGYATCHWCHVMAHESFENEEVADILNNAYIPIKVDREEHPELDAYCMASLTAQTGQGGWPLNCFMDSSGRPFYAVTYLPPQQRGSIPGLIELLMNIRQVWDKNRRAVDENAVSIAQAITPAVITPLHRSDEQYAALIQQAREKADQGLLRIYDQQHGGFGSAPKFPMPPYLYYCLTHPEQQFVEMGISTLRTIFTSGSYDQLAGGLHRYATDPAWRIPHFEKMLYDQALGIYCACVGFERTQDPAMLQLATGIADFCKELMITPTGGWYSAIDADSEGEEGTYYLWSHKQIVALFGDTLGPEVARFFQIPREGLPHLQGKATLHPRGAAKPYPDWYPGVIDRLRSERNHRELPLIDTKLLTGWNALMLAGLARLAALVPDGWYREGALRTRQAIDQLLTSEPQGLLHSSGRFPHPQAATLEDRAFMAFGLAELSRIEPRETDQAHLRELLAQCDRDSNPDTRGARALPYPYGAIEPHDGVILSAQSAYAMARLRSGQHWPDHATITTVQGERLVERPLNKLWFLATLPHTP